MRTQGTLVGCHPERKPPPTPPGWEKRDGDFSYRFGSGGESGETGGEADYLFWKKYRELGGS